MERRRMENDDHLRHLARESETLETELARRRRELSDAGTGLELGQDSVSRLVQRLALRER
jgi:hypothetical protein